MPLGQKTGNDALHQGNLALSDCCLREKPAANDECASERVLAGQYFDAETGFNYNHHRYYCSECGRYITSDPIGLRGGLNTYVYVGGMPTRYVDPSGLEATTLPTPGVTPLPIFIPPVAIPGSKENQAWVEMVNDAMDNDNVIPFPTKPTPETETKESCPPPKRDGDCTFTGKAGIVPANDGYGFWLQCQYKCPKKGTKIYTSYVGIKTENPAFLCASTLPESSF
ncbi:MAG TPA: RHS repeat-associated core domain-containing protein [Gammaproteobacteria bacterium]